MEKVTENGKSRRATKTQKQSLEGKRGRRWGGGGESHWEMQHPPLQPMLPLGLAASIPHLIYTPLLLSPCSNPPPPH